MGDLRPAGLPLLTYARWRRFLERLNGEIVDGDWRVAAEFLLVSEPVTVRPLLPAGQAPLNGPPPLRLHLWVETGSIDGDPPRRVTEKTELQLRADAGEIKWPLYLETATGLRAGQVLRLRAQDADSGREYDSIALTLLRDLD